MSESRKIRSRDIEWVNHPTMNPRNTNQLRKLIERREKAHLWGQPHIITPRLCGEIFGDGRQLMVLYPIMYRPNHFIVRIDSSWDLDGDVLRDHLDDIEEAIADEFYEWPWARSYGLRWHEDETHDNDSRINWADGSCWGSAKWPRLKKRRRPAPAPREEGER